MNQGHGADDTVLTLHRLVVKLVPAGFCPLVAPSSPLGGPPSLTRSRVPPFTKRYLLVFVIFTSCWDFPRESVAYFDSVFLI